MIDLDVVDRRLICLLRRDPRASYQRLAEQVGMSRPAVRGRVRHLLDSGTLRITGVPHPRTQGLTIAAELLVDTALSAEQVAAALGGRPYLTVGYADELVVVSLWCRDDTELVGLADRLRAYLQTRSVEVFRIVRLLRPALVASSALDEERIRLDERDQRLMGLLVGDPRAPYSRLGGQIGLSQAATRARVLRLLKTGAVTIEVTGRSRLPSAAVLIGITVQGPASSVAGSFLDLSGLAYLALGHGRHDLLARLVTPPDQQHVLYRQIREMPGVGQMQVRQTTCEDDLPVLGGDEGR